MSNRILILGASGFIGSSLYRELQPYFDVYGTHCRENKEFEKNRVFFRFNFEEDDILEIIEKARPNVIISSLKGKFSAQYKLHQQLAGYALLNEECRLLYLSSVAVFDGAFRFPSYETDIPQAESGYGKFKISVEKLLRDLPREKVAILRLPIVLGVNSPRIHQLQQAIRHQAAFEVFPNRIISITTSNKVAQQVHYIINKQLYGIFHLASYDMVHHEDLFRELTEKLSGKMPIFKSVFSSNDDHYFAILPKVNKLPKPYRISVAEVIEESTLNEEISTLKY